MDWSRYTARMSETTTLYSAMDDFTIQRREPTENLLHVRLDGDGPVQAAVTLH